MRHPLDDHTAEWHERRLSVIGGSDANKIMSGEWRDLYLVKTGEWEGDDLSNILAVQMGSWTEALNLAWYYKQTGLRVSDANCAHIVHPNIPYMGGNLDGRIDILGKDVVFEAKHTNSSMNIDKAVSRYYPQLQHLMCVIDADEAHLSCFFGNSKWDKAIVPRDQAYIDILIEWEEEFWSHVESELEPEDRPGYGKMIDTSTLKIVDMTGNNMWADLADQYHEHSANAASFERAKKSLKELIESDVGEAHGHGIRIKRSTNKSLRVYEEKQDG
jgi:predicted phage-related endonuclease